MRWSGSGNFFDKIKIVTPVDTWKEGESLRTYDLSWTPGLAPTLVVIDESHECLDKKSPLRMMEKILAVTLYEEENITRVPLWLFVSATPWKGSLSNVNTWLPFIYS